MASLEYISSRNLQKDIEPPVLFSQLRGYNVARQLPNLLREQTFDFQMSDKVFCSEWLSESDVVLGTKCNKLYVLDTIRQTRIEIPNLSSRGGDVTGSCGVHCVSLSPDKCYLATGGGCSPNDLALYQLPELQPLIVGEAHSDWIFDIQWITDSLLISASRDSTMALWAVNGIEDSNHCLAENVPSMTPIFQFSNQHYSSSPLTNNHRPGERVRSLAYDNHRYTLSSLQSNPCGAAVHFWDVFVFQQVSKLALPHCAENVCVEVDDEQMNVIGSRSHITFIDGRHTKNAAKVVLSPDKDCGVRSLQFNEHLLSVGTGGGHLYFYDTRAGKFLIDSNSEKFCSLCSSPGWLRKDQTFRDFFSGLPLPPNAIYTHCYNPLKTKIFTAGGPLPLGLYGSYASVWT